MASNKNFKSLAQKLGHIFDPIISFEHLTNLPTEKEVVCRFIAIFDTERKSYHNASSAENSTFPILAKELVEFWKNHNIFQTENAVVVKLRKILIPKMKLILRKIPQSDPAINKIHRDFSDTFGIHVSPGNPSKKIRQESPRPEDVENFGKKGLIENC